MSEKIELFEKCNKKIARYVLNNIEKVQYRLIEDLNYDPKEKIISYLKNVINSKDGKIKVQYLNKNEERYFSKGYGLQPMLREFRHTLFDTIYYDIDIKNAHPTLLSQYCDKNDISCTELKKYNENRDIIFKKLVDKGYHKEDIKRELLKIMNGGKLSEDFDILKKLDIELKNIQKLVLMLNKDIEKQVKKEKNYNIEGSVLNHLLCKLENKILMSAVEFFKKNNFVVGALCFDGLMIEKTKELNEEMLSSLNKYVKKSTEYKVEFLVKPMNEGLKINIDELKDIEDDVIIETDEQGANYIIEILNNSVVKSNGRVFLKKFEDTNIYNEDESQKFTYTKEYLLQLILKSQLKKETKDGLIHYSQNMNGARNLVDATFALIENDDDFIEKTWESNINKLCFLNGYYNFKNSTFNKYDKDTYTTVYVNSNYDDNVDEKYIEILYNKILNPILNNKETQKRFLNWCSRGLAGQYTEKTWSVGLGFRNSGKSVITDFFEETFNNYVGSFNAEELLCNRVGNGDIAKKLSWLIPFQFRRLNFSNELKSVDENGKTLKLDGNQIKSVSSGGDKKKARKNYKDEMTFKIQGRMCLFMNDLIKTDPIDASETLQIFEFMSIFKKDLTEDEIKINSDKECETKYFLKDDNIKQLIKDENIKKAFIKVILEAYSNEPMINNNIDDFIETDNTLSKIIKEHYDITLNKDDKIKVEDINEYNKEYLSNFTKSKIKQTFSSLGICDKSITENKKTIRYYVGLKKKKIAAVDI